MTTYYVRTGGSDAAAGTSAGAAWLTVDKAANTVAAGDIVWIGAGVYRETVTIDTSGTLGSEIEWRADIDGSQTGDPGLVVWTVLSDETGTGGTGSVLDLNGKEYNEFYDVVFGPGGSGSTDFTILATTGNTTYQGILFDTCTIIQPIDSQNESIDINYGTGGTIAGNKPAFRDCEIYGNVTITYGAFTADSACGWVFENCVINGKITIDGPNSGSFGPSGYSINNCQFTPVGNLVIFVADQWNTGSTGEINNCIFLQNISPIQIVADGGTWAANNNKTLSDLATWPTGSNNNTSCGFLFGSNVEHIYRKWFGWSPFGAHEQVWDVNGGGYKSGGIDAGSATYAPAADMYGNARPMGASDDVGAVEANPRGARSATWAADGSIYSMAFDSTGFYESRLPVDAVSTTISVKAYKNASYAGTAPMIEVFIGKVSQGTASMTVGNEVEETLSVNFTPSAAGWARVRIYSYATAGTVYFDSLAVA